MCNNIYADLPLLKFCKKNPVRQFQKGKKYIINAIFPWLWHFSAYKNLISSMEHCQLNSVGQNFDKKKK